MLPRVSQTIIDSEQATSDSAEHSIKQADQTLFRRAAVDAYTKGVASEGVIFEAEPEWIKYSYMTLLAGIGALLLFVIIGRVHEYAQGPMVVQVGKQFEVTAIVDANIGKVLVSAGDEVKVGEPILQLYQAQAIAGYQRLKKEFELRLRQRLMSPNDTAIESALVSLHADMDQAKADIDQRLILAEINGVVGDIRIRAGQRVAAGQVLMSVTNNSNSVRVTAFLPGKYRPQLQPGMQLQLTLDGYPYSIQYLSIDKIGEEIIGPAEVRQFLGNIISDGLDIEGANFIVEAMLDNAKFNSEGEDYTYHHGMLGIGEVKISSEPILITLFPSLKKVL